MTEDFPEFRVQINMVRNRLRELSGAERLAEGRLSAKMRLLRRTAQGSFSDRDVPDFFVDDDTVSRFLELEPPVAAVIPEFQEIINEIEDAYVSGLYFAALSAACVSIERMLNLARIKLHCHHQIIKKLWNKGPSNAWDENIEALCKWGYFSAPFAEELGELYEEVRNQYLHSGAIKDMRADALRAVSAAYKLLGIFIGFPEPLFTMSSGTFVCQNQNDPRFKAFYESPITDEQEPKQ